MQITLKLFRYNPEIGRTKPSYDTYTLDVDPTDRILDLLEYVKDHYDGTLGFRRSCAHGVCGSDAMRINGRNALACKVLVQDLDTTTIQVDPMLGMRIIKDFIVDMEPFFESYRSINPYFVGGDIPADGKERIQTIEARARFDDTTKCILCGACTTSCPSFWSDEQYVGPAAIVNAHRFIFDDRDVAYEERLNILAEESGVFRCRTAFNCTEACPREIHITQAIAEVKKAIVTGKIA
jgi:succinate dehydrogenase / fumarate reductase, iron-sulfur subunit